MLSFNKPISTENETKQNEVILTCNIPSNFHKIESYIKIHIFLASARLDTPFEARPFSNELLRDVTASSLMCSLLVQ